MKLSQHLFLCIGLFRFCLQRNTVLNTKETLKVLPLSDRLAAENSQFSWCDEYDIKIAPVIALVLLFDSRSKTALSAYVVCQSYFTWTSRAWSLMIKKQWWGTGVRGMRGGGARGPIKANLYFLHSLLDATLFQVDLFIHLLGVEGYNNEGLVLHAHN